MLFQRSIMELIRFSHSSPKQLANHWIYESAALVDCPAARVRLTANNILGAHWNLVNPTKLGPTPPKPAVRSKGNQSAVPPKGILKGSIGNEPKLILSPFGQFRFHKSAMKKPVIAADFSRAKAPRVYNSFFSFRTCVINEGYAAGETLVVQQFHIFFDHIFAVDSSIVFYAYPGRVPHSRLVVLYSADHIIPKVIGKKKIAAANCKT